MMLIRAAWLSVTEHQKYTAVVTQNWKRTLPHLFTITWYIVFQIPVDFGNSSMVS